MVRDFPPEMNQVPDTLKNGPRQVHPRGVMLIAWPLATIFHEDFFEIKPRKEGVCVSEGRKLFSCTADAARVLLLLRL